MPPPSLKSSATVIAGGVQYEELIGQGGGNRSWINGERYTDYNSRGEDYDGR